jgi:hypothetical protein
MQSLPVTFKGSVTFRPQSLRRLAAEPSRHGAFVFETVHCPESKIGTTMKLTLKSFRGGRRGLAGISHTRPRVVATTFGTRLGD